MSFPKFAVFIKAYLNGSGYTVISRKVAGKNVHATIPKGNMRYDQYTVPSTTLTTVAVEPTKYD